MSRTTRHWIAFGAVAAGGVLLAIVVNFIFSHPWQFVAIVLLAWSIGTGSSSRGPWPFNATIRKLGGARNRIVCLLRDFGLWGAILVGMIYAVHVLIHRGGGQALAVLSGIYLADRLLAWAIGYVRRAADRRAAAAEPVVEDEPVVVECSTGREGGL